MPEEQTKQVLIVDDDRFLLNMYSLKFKKSGFAVETATGGEEALQKLRNGLSPTVLLLDVVMPVMDGMELLENIRKEKLAERATVIVLSNQNQPADLERAKRLGIRSYIVKANAIPSEVVAEVLKITEK